MYTVHEDVCLALSFGLQLNFALVHTDFLSRIRCLIVSSCQSVFLPAIRSSSSKQGYIVSHADGQGGLRVWEGITPDAI